jgi:hypothetical protein
LRENSLKFSLGKANCPQYAKAELLGDYLQRNLPNFIIHKWAIEPNVRRKYSYKMKKIFVHLGLG